MRGLPPLTDLVTVSAVSSVRNNGDRRFFQPFLLDRYGDRGNYYGQQINAGNGKPESPSDPNWNAMADPRWSPDGASVSVLAGSGHQPGVRRLESAAVPAGD